MSAHKLSKRLSYIRNSTRTGNTTGARSGTGVRGSTRKRTSPSGVSPAWKQVADYVFIREYDVPFSLPEICRTAPLLGSDIPSEDCLFYDTETTGLSGGAGTLAFLVGIGRYAENRLHIQQFFLADFPGERELLRVLAGELDENRIYVSYNGKTFDSHLLRTRFLFHGMHTDITLQADLLYPARRLWKHRLPNCTLSVVEREVLGVKRTGDVPGREVPEYYFTFLQNGSMRLLEGVFSHNKQDIISLASLLHHYHAVCTQPLTAHPGDRLYLGKILLEHGDERGLELLQREFNEGSTEAGLLLGRWYKRSGNSRDALSVWKLLWRRKPGLDAGLAMAKHFEHTEKQYAKALELVDRLLSLDQFSLSGEGSRQALAHRKRRLLYKIERKTGRTE